MPNDIITKARLQDVLDRRATVNIAGRTSQSTDIFYPSGQPENIYTDAELSGIENRYTDRLDDITYYTT